MALWTVPAITLAGDAEWKKLSPYFEPPAEWKNQFGDYRSPLLFEDGSEVRNADDWQRRRREILATWHRAMGEWPPILERPTIKYLEETRRGELIQHRVTVQVAERQHLTGYLLIPPGEGPFPAVFVPFYDPETSVGLSKKPRRDFAYQLALRGFVTLSLGSPGGDARKPDTAGHNFQPLSYLAYVAANAHQALASLPSVDGKRIGIVGHSYGGKWAMFGSCLYEKYAAAAWSDGGIVWDEKRSNINYWDPWYLGFDATTTRKLGLITPANPRLGAYKSLVESGHDLHELHALMAPRPFLVSGGSEDLPARWIPLQRTIAVNRLLGFEHRVGMTNRPTHEPTAESNELICEFSITS